MIRCSQNVNTEFAVESSSSSKTYRVRAFLPDEEPTCNCVAFAISRNRNGGKNHGAAGFCKHIRQVLAETCDWMDGISPEKQTIPGICPKCGEPSIDSTPVVMPEDPKKATDAVTERLQQIAAELSGGDELFGPTTLPDVEEDEDEDEDDHEWEPLRRETPDGKNVQCAKCGKLGTQVKLDTVEDLLKNLK